MKLLDFHETIGTFPRQLFSVHLPKNHSSKRILMGVPFIPFTFFACNLADVQHAGDNGDRWVLKKDGWLPHSAAHSNIPIVPEMFMMAISIRWRKID